MTAYEYIKTHVLTILKPSRIHGVGIFAVRDIDEGVELFVPWKGESGIYSITQDEMFTLPSDLHEHLYSVFDNKMLYTDKDGDEKFVEKEYGKLFFKLEYGYHWQSIWPKTYMNSGLHNANTQCVNSNTSVTIRKIKRGEEILGTYGIRHKFTPKNFI